MRGRVPLLCRERRKDVGSRAGAYRGQQQLRSLGSLGIVLAVMPWNFPFWQVFRFLAPALMAGNVGLLKHAPNVPQCAVAIESLTRRAGFPRGSFQSLLLETPQVEMVLGDERVAAVTVTGSEAAGRAIGAQAGWLIKKSVLELGGSDPFIVMGSADLDAAVATAVRARTINSGQSCIAAKRFIVAEEVYREFKLRFVEAMENLRVGDPMFPETQIGPLAMPRILENLEAQVQAAVKAGARILTGGKRVGSVGNFFQPTVLAGVPSSLRCLSRRAVRAGSDALPGPRPRRGDPACQRHSLRSWCLRLDPRTRRTASARSGTGMRVGVPERNGGKRSPTAIRRNQALRLWAGTVRSGHARIHERQDCGRRCSTAGYPGTRDAAGAGSGRNAPCPGKHRVRN